MRITHRPVMAVAVTAVAAVGLAAQGPAARAEPRPGPGTAPAVDAGGLYAWESAQPSGPPDMVFEGFGCRNTGGRFNAWRSVEREAVEVWALFDDAHCHEFVAVVNPQPEPQAIPGVESVQRLR
ncbi:hypothetical protein E1264_34365 [Actinomadura sp. KC216]|uniref:hypothetical protein n=1 Tax=Actinomadura sp. KC216 TaxID=2530370 RepID=UPI0010436DE9|nr:hypothetical protein [Actinomadura sp. KC216]TDB80247.1 hypothetical protein E1264_34365 [Actinomadura sp. KC216]